MRIAIINRDRCQPRKCSKECEYFCPPVRTGDETIVFEDGKPLITENLCVGWIGGLMNTFPMLALGDEMHRQRGCIRRNGSCHNSQLPTQPPCATKAGFSRSPHSTTWMRTSSESTKASRCGSMAPG